MSTWRTSSFCTTSEACVEVARMQGCIAIRDSRLVNEHDSALVIDLASWQSLCRRIASGEFNLY